MSATQERDQVGRLASTSLSAALRIARKIHDPWFRCQALAFVAWHEAEPRRFLRLVAESLESGWSIENPNRAATVVAWPVAAIARRRFPDPVARERIHHELLPVIDRLTRTLAAEPSPASRADALLMHVHALSPSQPLLRKKVLDRLVKECRIPTNRKRQRQLEEAALVIAPDDPETALGLTALLDESRKHRTIARTESQPELLGPRPFFKNDGMPPLKSS